MGTLTYQISKLGIEDLETGTGTFEQVRGEDVVELTKISASTMPWADGDDSLEDVLDSNYPSIEIVGDNIDDVIITADNITSVNTNATNIASINTNTANIGIINVTATNIDAINTNATSIDDISVGRIADSTPGSFMNGEVTEVAIWDVALTDASREASYTISDKAVEEAEKLLPRAEECDPGFSTSVTARLFEGSVEFVPQMAVDLTGYYEDIRNRHFGEWSKLKGQEKVRRIEYLLELIAEMEPPKDPVAFEQILIPERRLLEEALKAPDEQPSSSGSDPNF